MNNKKGYMNMVIHAGEIQMCVLYQGCINRNDDEITVTEPLNVGDFVELDMHVESLYGSGGEYIPVVCKNISRPIQGTGTHPAQNITQRIGQVISEPRWLDIPDDDVWDWRDMIQKRYFQIVPVEIFKSIFVSDSGRYILVEDWKLNKVSK